MTSKGSFRPKPFCEVCQFLMVAFSQWKKKLEA